MKAIDRLVHKQGYTWRVYKGLSAPIVLLPGFQKGRDIQGFLRKRAGSSFGPKMAICVVQGKT
jgi:hypothetical protein